MGETEPLVNRDELLDAMRNAAYQEANQMLSMDGRDVLRMLSYANRHTKMGIVEAYTESTAFNRLPPDDQQLIEIYLARITLVEEFRTYEAQEG
jgi:hypothetical protein